MRARLAAAVAALALLLGACSTTIEVGVGSSPSAAPVPPSPETFSPAPAGPGSAAAALEKLCRFPEPPVVGGPAAEGPTPPAIAEVLDAVEQMRGLSFTDPIVADAASQQELTDGLLRQFDYYYPRELYDRKSLAWRTIGVIPEGTSIRDALHAFYSTQIIGYYDTQSGELVFIGTADPTPFERVTLAHELTHAIDDQNFGLERLDRLSTECRDDAGSAAVAVVEGNATYFMFQYAQRFLSVDEQVEFGLDAVSQAGGATPTGIPPFIQQMQGWPYEEGLRFITALASGDGLRAIDGAMREFPVSTEQIIHPERYPNDVPTPLDIPDLAPELGSGWNDLDVQDVGEEWLSIALDLRMNRTDAASAAAGWDGGLYRAWSDGDHVAVLLTTVWDTDKDAAEFADAMRGWIVAGGHAAMVFPPLGDRVTVGFASDASSLALLEAAI